MIAADVGKRAAALAALAYLRPDTVIGVGTGSTVAHFIDALGAGGAGVTRAVATSIDTEQRLLHIGISPIALEDAEKPFALYVDGADEVDFLGRAIKGGGGAHTREKRVAQASSRWVCVVDESKLVDRLGMRAPVPLEVESVTLAAVMAAVAALGGSPELRAGILTDSGNPLLDIHGLDLSDPRRVEDALEAIPGVVACGIFARRRADVILVGRKDGSVLALIPDDEGNSL
ncbi:MAG: ribose-5-phosphate isomerase RpiA [Actinomycetota bacterium]|nr:ribose-5-phosphate isomerase RpiA [Actinomycetota bacterium]